MGLFGATKDYKKYKKAYELAQLLYPRHPQIWTDRIVKLPDNKYVNAAGKLVYNDEIYPYAVYTEFEGMIKEMRQRGYTIVDAAKV